MRQKLLSYLLVGVVFCSCVDNHLPKPVFVPEITSLTVEGAISVNIDPFSHSVLLDMEETSDLGAVKITSCIFNNGSMVKSSRELVGTFDLRTPLEFTLTTYDVYHWKIYAVQSIERVFTLKGQVGKTVIDEPNKRIIVTLSKSTPMTWTNVTECKLGPEGQTSYSEDPFVWKDFSSERKIVVSYRDITEIWTIYVEQSNLAVDMRDVSPRVTECYLRCDAPDGAENGFVYRRKGEEKWLKVEKTESSSGTLSGVVEDLSASTEYECAAYSGKDSTEVYEFTTLEPVQIPNAGLNVISKCESSNYFSFFNPESSDKVCASKWWDTGNIGSTTIGESYAITVPDSEDKMEGEYSANLISRFVIVKFAAGNIFSGSFAGLVGTSGGKVHFGRPFTARPKALKLWMKYINGPIDNFNGAPEGDPVKYGDPDKGQVFIALGDWDWKIYGGTAESPVLVNTTDKSTLFNPDTPAVIAYGSYLTDKPTDGWEEITIPLDYRDDFRIPTHIIVSCASSYLGDYFSGCSTSRMWVDDFRLTY